MDTVSFDLPRMVSQARAGDRAAFAELVTRYKNLVFSVAMGVLHDADGAADVTQAVFVSAWQRLGTLRQPASLPPWLRETARRQALHHLRTARRVRRREQLPEPDTVAGAEAQLLEREQNDALEAALDQLPAEAREILLLYYSEEQSVDQVAVLLDLSPDAVKKRLQRARGALREDVEQRLAARVRRLVPGAALVAAVLALLDAPAHAAARPRMRPSAPWIVAALTLALCVGPWVARRLLRGRPAIAAQAASRGGRGPSAAGAGAVAARGPAPAPRGAGPPAGEATAPSAAGLSAACVFPATKLLGASLALDADDLHALRGLVRVHPDSAALRFQAAVADWGPAMHKQPARPEDLFMSSAWVADVSWLIERCPDAPWWIAPLFPIDPDDPARGTLAAAWERQLARHRNDPRVYGNASNLFVLTDPRRAEQLLARAAELAPDDTRWLAALGQVHALDAIHGPTRGEASQNAVGYYEQALARAPDDAQLLERAAQAALTAGDAGLASQRAQELLAQAPDLDPADRADALHAGNAILGRLAVERGALDEAERYLARAADVDGSAVLSSFGPDLDLPRALLTAGRTRAVLGYLDRVGRFWDGGHCLDDWKQMIRGGQRPAFVDWDCHAVEGARAAAP